MTSEEAKIERSEEHFERVLNYAKHEIINNWSKGSEVESLAIITSPITVDEVRVAMRKLKNNCS